MSTTAIQRAAIQHALDNETQRERRRILDVHFPDGATAVQRALVDLVAKSSVYRLQIARLNHHLGVTGQLEAVPPADEWADIYKKACAALGIPPALLLERKGHA